MTDWTTQMADADVVEVVDEDGGIIRMKTLGLSQDDSPAALIVSMLASRLATEATA